jgi:hypothetical protein
MGNEQRGGIRDRQIADTQETGGTYLQETSSVDQELTHVPLVVFVGCKCLLEFLQNHPLAMKEGLIRNPAWVFEIDLDDIHNPARLPPQQHDLVSHQDGLRNIMRNKDRSEFLAEPDVDQFLL